MSLVISTYVLKVYLFLVWLEANYCLSLYVDYRLEQVEWEAINSANRILKNKTYV